ncbi:MAG: carboxylesterase family protein [Bacteroidales bacterium]
MLKKNVFLIVFAFLLTYVLSAQQITTRQFAVRDTQKLYMDLYQPEKEGIHPCIVYVFGGGFINGTRNKPSQVEYFKQLSNLGYVVAAIDYRLGLKGVHKMGVGSTRLLEKAINMAVEDYYAAIRYLYDHAKQLQLDPHLIIGCGSSAGAITVLQADYKLANGDPLSKELPEGFHFAGVVAFSGAVFSRAGKVDYKKQHPAPTLFYHGTADKLVIYNKLQFFNLGFFGSSALVKRSKKFEYPYYIIRYTDLGHEVCNMYLENISITNWFIQEFIIKKKKLEIDETYFDPAFKRPWYSNLTPTQLYKLPPKQSKKLEEH